MQFGTFWSQWTNEPCTKSGFPVHHNAKLCMAGTAPLALKRHLPLVAHLKMGKQNQPQAAAAWHKCSQGLKVKRHSTRGVKQYLSSLKQSLCFKASQSLLTSHLIPLYNYIYLNWKNNYIVLAHFCSRKESRFLCQMTSQFHCKVKLLQSPPVPNNPLESSKVGAGTEACLLLLQWPR